MWSLPPIQPGPKPVVALVFLDTPAFGVSERLSTMLALIPKVRLLPSSAFPEDRQDAIRKVVAGIAPYPDPLAKSVLKKHLDAIGADGAVIVAAGQLYIQTKTGLHEGPFSLPGLRGKLPDMLVEKLCALAVSSGTNTHSSHPRQTKPFYRNWLFWTGVGLIVGAIATVSFVSRDSQEVEVEVFH